MLHVWIAPGRHPSVFDLFVCSFNPLSPDSSFCTFVRFVLSDISLEIFVIFVIFIIDSLFREEQGNVIFEKIRLV